MDIRSEIKKLARIEASPYPFFSLYLNTRWDSEQQRERIRLFVKNQLKKGMEEVKKKENWEKLFPEDQQRIERFVEGLVRRSYEEEVDGVAMFSCSANDLFLTYPSIIPFENQFFIADQPVLSPLVRLSSQYQDTLAVMVETDSAKLFEIALEGLLAEFSIENYVPGRHDQGGWAQMRYQRHIRDHINKHHKEVSEQLIELFDTGKWKRVVLIGQDRTLANFKSFLPERVKQKIADTFTIDFAEERSKILRQIVERLFQREKEEVAREIEGLKEKTPARATLGLTGTLEALNKGQIQTLYLLSSFNLPGWLCPKCKTLDWFRPPLPSQTTCLFCRGHIKEVPLEEEMMRSVLRQDGEVRWIDDHIVLKEHDGVGATLRFSAARSASI